jgi:hypothetical protein
MDFDVAEERLKSDHDRLKRRVQHRSAGRTLASSTASSKAKKLEEYRRKQREKKKLEEQLEKKKHDNVKNMFHSVERRLGVVREISNSSIQLEPTSIYGQGDKITLPSSVLAALAEKDLLSSHSSQKKGQPLFFRLGIKRDKYQFPQSQAMLEFISKISSSARARGDYDDEILDDDDDDDDDDEEREEMMKMYLDELSCEYVSYTYATVVEFSEDEGSIGLPASAAAALLNPSGSGSGEIAIPIIESRVTIDPAASALALAKAETAHGNGNDVEMNDDENGNASIDTSIVDDMNIDESNLESKTPGHPAYGLFPVPVSPIEVTLVTSLPLGEKCTIQPTLTAIENGFYNLKNVKAALETSLMRTRGSLNVGDLMHCWFRGKKFDLTVQKVHPNDVGAISCVNCDIEVDIAPAPNSSTSDDIDTSNECESAAVDGDDTNMSTNIQRDNTPSKPQFCHDLPPEPEPDAGNGNVIDIQIRGGGGKSARRRFESASTMHDLFNFAMNEDLSDGLDLGAFNLVTRFPRRVLNDLDKGRQLKDLNLGKQEMFMVEK